MSDPNDYPEMPAAEHVAKAHLAASADGAKLSPERIALAKRIGDELAARLFEGRRGHGSDGIGKRVLDQGALALALTGAAEIALEADARLRGER